MDKIEKQRRAEAYARLYEDEYFTDAFDRVRAALIKQLDTIPVGDTKAMERLHLSHTLMNTLQQLITRTIRDDEVARKQIAKVTGEKQSLMDYLPRVDHFR